MEALGLAVGGWNMSCTLPMLRSTFETVRLLMVSPRSWIGSKNSFIPAIAAETRAPEKGTQATDSQGM